MNEYPNYPNNGQPPFQQGIQPPEGYIQKSRIAAGLLAMLLGAYGVHSFYLGNTSRGILQLLVSALTCGVGAIVMFVWGILEGIKILDGRINTDFNGVYLKE